MIFLFPVSVHHFRVQKILVLCRLRKDKLAKREEKVKKKSDILFLKL